MTPIQALAAELAKLFKVSASTVVMVHADTEDSRVAEISFVNGNSGSSYMRNDASLECFSLLLACEDFLCTYGMPPYRPQGWTTDIDEHGDACERLAHIVKLITEETT